MTSIGIEVWLRAPELKPDPIRREARAKAVGNFAARAKFDDGLDLIRMVAGKETSSKNTAKRLREAIKKHDATFSDQDNEFELRTLAAASLQEILARADTTSREIRLALEVTVGTQTAATPELALLSSHQPPLKTTFPETSRREVSEGSPQIASLRTEYQTARNASNPNAVFQHAPAFIDALEAQNKANAIALGESLTESAAWQDLTAILAWSILGQDAKGASYQSKGPADAVLQTAIDLAHVSGTAAISVAPDPFLRRALAGLSNQIVSIADLRAALTASQSDEIKGIFAQSKAGDLTSLVQFLLSGNEPGDNQSSPSVIFAVRLFNELALLRLTREVKAP